MSKGNRKYNPERRAWRGRSHRKGGVRVKHLRENCESIKDSMVSLDHGIGREAAEVLEPVEAHAKEEVP